MTRFEANLQGRFGEFWKQDAQRQIKDMQVRADAGEILTDAEGGAYWKRSGNYIPADCAEMLSYTTFDFSMEATQAGREKQTAESIARYRKQQANRRISAEERAEMQAAFGKGATVVDIITGQTIRL